jgi:hypothetical protein
LAGHHCLGRTCLGRTCLGRTCLGRTCLGRTCLGRSCLDRNRRWPAADNGSAPLELVILAPVVMALIGLVIAAGRTSIAQGSLDAAARDAARQASISLSPGAARQSALSSAEAALRADGLDCRPVVRLELLGFSVPPGQPAQVSASVRCAVPLADLLVPGVPGSRTLTARFVSPLDPYRARDSSFSNFEPLPARYAANPSPQSHCDRRTNGGRCHRLVTLRAAGSEIA